MSDYEQQADRAERTADEMQERSDHLEDEISGAREDWERKKRDPQVPTAADAEDAAGDPPPEQQYPAKGD
jgi:hypothetical protein